MRKRKLEGSFQPAQIFSLNEKGSLLFRLYRRYFHTVLMFKLFTLYWIDFNTAVKTYPIYCKYSRNIGIKSN